MDINTIVNSVLTGAVTLGMAWIGYQSHLADLSRARLEETVKKIEVKAAKIELQTDGVVTGNLKTIAIAAENLAESSTGKANEKQNRKLAQDAWEAYDDRVKSVERAQQQEKEKIEHERAMEKK